MRLLLIEDNDRLSEFLEKALRDANFTVDRVADLRDADAAMAGARFDAVILDLGLPDGNGLDLLQARRAAADSTPILVLTARDGLSDRVDGLNHGADDYMTKPFAMEELVARIKALLRRPGAALGVQLNLGNVSLDTSGPALMVEGKRAGLTRRELALMEILLRRPGNVVNRTIIEDGIYGFDDEVGTNALEVLVSRLRKKLTANGADIHLHTVRGVGYMVMEPH
ncbi:MAG: response regulator transcription factor [Rhodospirillaceae bacterium]|nr:MAG: response regulator transcription factor [Rhodospirillaceae bacterium]